MRRAMLLPLVALLFAPAMISAQNRPHGGDMMPMNAARLLIENRADLSLSDTQVASLETIAKSLEERTASLREAAHKARQEGADREAMRGHMLAMRALHTAAFDNEIRPVLDAQQAERAQKLLAERRGRGPRHGHGPGH